MTEGISQARQALRDYAREAHTVPLKEVLGAAWVADPPDIPDGLMLSTSRGEAGGNAFMAAQAALTVAEELRAEGTQPVTRELEERLTFVGAQGYKRAQREAADRIEAIVLKAITS